MNCPSWRDARRTTFVQSRRLDGSGGRPRWYCSWGHSLTCFDLYFPASVKCRCSLALSNFALFLFLHTPSSVSSSLVSELHFRAPWSALWCRLTDRSVSAAPRGLSCPAFRGNSSCYMSLVPSTISHNLSPSYPTVSLVFPQHKMTDSLHSLHRSAARSYRTSDRSWLSDHSRF